MISMSFCVLCNVRKNTYFCAAKFIAIFLSVIVLTLTVMPCCALEDSDYHVHDTLQKEKHELLGMFEIRTIQLINCRVSVGGS